MKNRYFNNLLITLFFLLAHNTGFSQINTFPYSENFDSGSPSWTTNNLGAINTNWELGSPNFGLTNSTHSGTNCWDVNLDSAYGLNAYCTLESPEFNFSSVTNATFSFWQNRNTEASWDGFHMEYSLNQGISWVYLGYFQDPAGVNWYSNAILNSNSNAGWDGNSNGWIQSSYNLSAFNNISSVKFRYVFTSDGTFVVDGASIDDFKITLPLSKDANLIALNTPINRLSSGLNTGPLNVTLKNNGATTFNAYSISYKINGGSTSTNNFTNSILPNDTIHLSLPGFIAPSGAINICLWVTLSGDLDHNNDTICSNGVGVNSYTIPFTDDFDSINKGWSQINPTDTMSKWQLGLPNFGITNSTHSGINCWDVNLVTGYQSNANTELWSPIFNFSGIYNSTLSFWKKFNTEAMYDGTRMDYSINGGSTWNVLGNFGDTLGVNWYNKTSIISSAQPAWAGLLNTWQKSTYKLSIVDNLPNVIFRFVFTSDASVNIDGMSVDDFKITTALAKDAILDSLIAPLFNASAGSILNPIQLKVNNNSNQNITNFSVGYKINNGVYSTANYTSTLSPNSSAYITLPGFTVPLGIYSITAYVNLSGDLDPSNDSLFLNEIGQSTIIPTSFENFESGIQTWITETLGDPNTNWEFGFPAYGSTSSTHSGNFAWDVNLTTAYQANANTSLFTPIYDLSNSINPSLSFWQNRNTSTSNGFFMEYFDSNVGSWQLVPNIVGPGATNWYNGTVNATTGLPGWTNNSNGWIKSSIDLNLLSITGTVQFKFVFVSGGFSTGDGLTIDDFKLNTEYNNDAELTSIISPGSQAAAGGNTDVTITLRNNGIQTLNSLNIKYRNNNGTPINYTWTGTLLYDSSTVVNLPQVFPSAGLNNIVVYVDWTNDEYHDNDTLKYNYTGVSVFAPPFTDNLENGNLYWYVTPSSFGSTTWELGAPNYGSTNSAHSGSNCWDINLTTPYGILANTALYSPIFNYNNALTSTLDFWMNYNSEINQDGLRLEYTTNGNVWNVLGIINDPNATNWYNGIITPQSKPGWSGNSGGWVHCIYNTTAFNGQSFIRYRFVFTSDLSLVAPGFSIDDFNVDETVGLNNLTDGIQFFVSPNPVNDQLYVHFKNFTNDATLWRDKKLSYQICDISGRLIKHSNNDHQTYSNDLIVPVNDLAKGIYQLMISVDGFRKVVRFVKE